MAVVFIEPGRHEVFDEEAQRQIGTVFGRPRDGFAARIPRPDGDVTIPGFTTLKEAAALIELDWAFHQLATYEVVPDQRAEGA